VGSLEQEPVNGWEPIFSRHQAYIKGGEHENFEKHFDLHGSGGDGVTAHGRGQTR
jgi:hypothetical protein